MAFTKKTLKGLVSADPVTLGTVACGATYVRILGFTARNFADATMAGAGTDNAIIVKLTDADGIVFFLDAGTIDYKTAAVNVLFEYDDVNTGLGISPKTATGVAWIATEGQSIAPPVVKSPITVTLTGGTTATDYFRIILWVEY